MCACVCVCVCVSVETIHSRCCTKKNPLDSKDTKCIVLTIESN